MKKYEKLSDLLIDYRRVNNLSQLDLATILDVDIRTVIRWENNETLIKPEKEKDLVERLFIPFQVIRNLNTEHPLALYYNPELRTYALSTLMQKVRASWYKEDLAVDPERIRLLSKDSDVEFVEDIQEINKNPKPIQPELIKEAAKLLPELNLILTDQSGFYAGHMVVLPLKYNSYLRLKNKETEEGLLHITDLNTNPDQEPLVFYYYSIYADQQENAYYIANRLLAYFKEKKYRNYLFAGITYRENKIEILKEMGLKIIWEETIDESSGDVAVFMEGNLDMFLFGKTL